MPVIQPQERDVVCRRCGAHHNGIGATHGGTPVATPGDYVICMDCGAISVLTAEPITRQPTGDEYEEFLSDLVTLRTVYELRAHIAGRQS